MVTALVLSKSSNHFFIERVSTTLLIRYARFVVTMDEHRRAVADGAVFIRDNVIEQVGPSADRRIRLIGSSMPAGM